MKQKRTSSFFRKIATLAVLLLVLPLLVTGCGGKTKEKVLIYSSAEDYVLEYLNKRLVETFPDYEITIEYLSTGNLGAKLAAEGTKTAGDIIQQLEYSYLAQLDKKGVLADLSKYDKSIYADDTRLSENYIIQYRNGSAVIVNTKVLTEKGLPEPKSYKDLLNPQYKGLISMPSPKASGTGYSFYKNLVNVWGEEAALKYFDDLTPNILQYTTSGSGPVNALVKGEAAVGLGITAQAVTQINKGAPLKIIFFAEGSPYALYGQTIIKGKENRKAVKDVFDFLINKFNYENGEKFFPEKIFKQKSFSIKNYPENIKYGDMKGDTAEEKTRLLAKWKY